STPRFSMERMSLKSHSIVMTLFLGLSTTIQLCAQHPAMPTGTSHEQHLAQMPKEAEMKNRGDAAMGFEQDAVTHHFLLRPGGGVIRVEVRNPADVRSLEAIRKHLETIAAGFGSGDFGAPLMTHGEVPPGVPTMQCLKAEIRYGFGETSKGGRVQIVTKNPEALDAVHAFLRYQITEHHTGDPLTVTPRR